MTEATDAALTAVGSVRPLLAVAIPAVAAVGLLVVRGGRGRRVLATGAALATAAVVLSMTFPARAGRVPVTVAGEIAPGVPVVLRADPLGLVFALTVAGIAVVGLPLVEHREERAGDSPGRVFACLVGALGTAMGVAFAGNLLLLVIALELLAIVAYPLVRHRETPPSRWAGYRYLAYTLTGGVLSLAGVRVIYAFAGTVSFVPGGSTALAAADPTPVGIAFGLLLLGFGVKAALVPLHGWVLGTRAAPAPAYALAFPVIVITAGTFAIVRTILDGFGPVLVGEIGLAWVGLALAGLTVLAANLLAVATADLERRLTYAAIAGAAAAPMGAFVLTPVALAGAIVHLAAQAIGIGVALLTVCHIQRLSTTASGPAIHGVGRERPVVGIAFGVAVASLIGVPLSMGFVAWWYLLVGAGAGSQLVVGAVLVVSAILHVVYLLPPLLSIAGVTAGDGAIVPSDRRRRSGDATAVLATDRRASPLLAGAAALLLLGSAPDQTVVLELGWLAVEAATGVSGP